MAITTAPPPAGRLDHRELRRFLNALRVQLWWRDALVLASASAVLGALIGTALLLWPARMVWTDDGPDVTAWSMLVLVAIGLLVAAVRRPSVVRAARVADRQLRLASRLATAAEVLDGRLHGGLATAQLEDTWRTCNAIRPWRAYPRGWTRVRAALVGAAFSLVVLGLTLGGVVSSLQVAGFLPGAGADDSQSQDVAADQSADAAAAASDPSLTADPSTNPAAAAQTLDQLQAAQTQSQMAQAALQTLADALRGTSAARDIGDSLRRGDYASATDKLRALAAQNDQLSRLSQRELATAMQRAAVGTAGTDAPLAVAENTVARSLTREDYAQTRQAMNNLADAIGDAQKGVISQEALAKQLDQLQQQQQPQATTTGGGADNGEEYVPDVPGQAPKDVGVVPGGSSPVSLPGPEGDPNKAARSGVGNEAGGDPIGDLSSIVNLPSLDVSVESQLANDQGNNKAQANAPIIKISDTSQKGVTPSDVVQPGDPVRGVAEQTTEMAAQRQSVRDFFKAPPDSAAP